MRSKIQSIPSTRMKMMLTALCVVLVGVLSTSAVDEVGDQASNFTIVNHKTGEPLNLYDFEGSVILLDFFAYWCPFCRAQSPQIESGITSYYHERKGNSNGVPVTVITVSFDCSNQSTTDQLIEQFGLGIVADDCALVAYSQFGVNGQPFYVIINGVTNSTSHLPWEVLHRQNSYGGNQAPLNTLRGVIDQVEGPPPELSNPRMLLEGSFEFEVPSYLERTNRVEWSDGNSGWMTLTNLSGTNGTVTIRDSGSTDVPQRFYRSIRD